MNKVAVVADSTCDLSKELVEKYNIKIVPLHVTFPNDSNDYLDGVTITPLEVYKKVEQVNDTPKTGARNVAEFINDFTPLINEGYDIIFTGIGSGLSSTYNNALLAAREFPEGRIEIVDSQNLSTGTGLLVLKMCELRDKREDVHTIASEVRKLVPLVSAKFCIDRLDYLFKGGRCSGFTKVLAHMLHIHPVAKVINNKLTVYKKIRGKYIKAVDAQLEEFDRDFKNNNIDTSHIFITDSHFMDGEDQYIYDHLVKYIPKENIHFTHAGCVVSSHCGPKTIGILYLLRRPE